MGDLIATAFSNFSRNREVGETLAKSGICCLESEGYRSVNSVIDILGKKYLSFPFLAAIKLIVLDNKKSTDSFCDLLENQFYI
jgi:glycerol-3-phosphate dehydrogenase